MQNITFENNPVFTKKHLVFLAMNDILNFVEEVISI